MEVQRIGIIVLYVDCASYIPHIMMMLIPPLPHPIILIEPDLPTLLNEVATVIPGKWRVVGNLLNIPKGVLDGLERKYSSMDSFEHVLTEWNSRRCSPYTWDAIITVLKAPAIGEVALANKLAAKYGKNISCMCISFKSL